MLKFHLHYLPNIFYIKIKIGNCFYQYFCRYGELDHYLSNLVPNGIVKIKNGNTMLQLGSEMKKNYMREMMKQMKEMMVNYKYKFGYDNIHYILIYTNIEIYFCLNIYYCRNYKKNSNWNWC